MSGDLGEFEGDEVVGATIAIRNAGDGLSAAMAVEPQMFHQGDTVFVVLECKVGPISFEPVKDADGKVQRKHVLKAGRATPIDRSAVIKAIEEMATKIQKVRDEGSRAQALDLNFDPLNVGGDNEADAEGSGEVDNKKPDGDVAAKTGAKASGAAKKTAAKKAPAKKTTGRGLSSVK